MKPWTTSNFPTCALRDPRLTPLALKVLTYLGMHKYEHSSIWPSQESLAAFLHHARPSINKAVKLLCETGYLEKQERKHRAWLLDIKIPGRYGASCNHPDTLREPVGASCVEAVTLQPPKGAQTVTCAQEVTLREAAPSSCNQMDTQERGDLLSPPSSPKRKEGGESSSVHGKDGENKKSGVAPLEEILPDLPAFLDRRSGATLDYSRAHQEEPSAKTEPSPVSVPQETLFRNYHRATALIENKTSLKVFQKNAHSHGYFSALVNFGFDPETGFRKETA